jgi:hypothetical protein
LPGRRVECIRDVVAVAVLDLCALPTADLPFVGQRGAVCRRDRERRYGAARIGLRQFCITRIGGGRR